MLPAGVVTVLVVDGPADLETADGVVSPDGDAAAFARPSDAVACALGLGVRAGLHTGEVDGWIGATLARCARIRDEAHPGQVLLSRATQSLVPDVDVRDLGVHRLRDLGRPEHLFQAGDGDFPPPRTLDSTPNNLPVQLSTFIGRTDELAQFANLVSDTRLLTVTGSGGCGKTRLTQHAAADAVDDYPGGVWFVDLSSGADPTAALAGVLGLKEDAGLDGITAHLVERRALVVLDNCETVVATAAGLAEALLRACGSVVVVATSREPLGVDGEVTWRVPNLTVPSIASTPAPEALAASDAVRLFIDRAARVRPNFAVTNETAPSVAQICQRLDGIPLAIELAAARVRVLSPQQIAAGLDDRFRLLGAGPRTAVPRHQTLRASIDSSWDLLEERERVLFRRLAVFPASFDLDAAEDVCSDDSLDRWRVLEVLASLVDRSLVVTDEDGNVTRYRMLETIRQYADELLLETGESERLRARHLQWYVALAEAIEPDLSTDQPAALERVDRDRDNFRAALAWGLDTDADAGGRLFYALLIHFYVRGLYGEWDHWCNAYLDRQGITERVRAGLLLSVVGAFVSRADVTGFADRAREMLAEGLEIARRIGDERLEGRLLTWQANVESMPDPAESAEVVQSAIETTRRAGDVWFVLEAIQISAGPAMMRGDAEGLARAAADGLAACAGVHDPDHAGTFLTMSGWAALFQSRLADAEAAAQEGLRIARESGNGIWILLGCVIDAKVALLRGETERAGRALGEARLSDMGAFRVLGDGFAGVVRLVGGDADGAVALIGPALEQWRPAGLNLFVVELLDALAEAHEVSGDLPRAREAAEDALATARRLESPYDEGRALHVLGRLARMQGEDERAESLLHDALVLHMQAGDRVGVVDTLESLAGIAASLQSTTESARLFGAAQGLRDEVGYVRFRVRQASYDADVALLGDATDAWAEGAAMSLEDAVTYARRGRGERKRPATGWASLTPAELEVVRLVAQGLTNAQIGERLFIAIGTVKAHVGHVYAKLGVSTRSELAVLGARRLSEH